MSVAAVVPVLERGEQVGSGPANVFRSLCGVPLLAYAIGSLTRASLVDLVVVAAPADYLADVHALLDGYQLDAECTPTDGSVRQTVADLPSAVDTVLVHDPDRPLAPPELVDAVVHAVRAGADAVLPAVPVADTVKETDATGRVLRTVDRGTLRTAQAPCGFRRAALCKAYASEPEAVDGAELDLVQRVGGSVVTIAGVEEAFRVVSTSDLALAEVVLSRQRGDHG